ncbi:hypothetical protein SDC9_201137 [bioreactor metagenome]|uniref:Uncharacterized protein n=1 Tax=bioreactor metagenome TaxID=1076179 RepID=A0A645J200_9ZZZZ
MAGQGGLLFTQFEIICQRAVHLFAEVENVFFSAFARHDECVVLQIDVDQINSDQLADANSGAEKKRQNRKIAHFCCIVI